MISLEYLAQAARTSYMSEEEYAKRGARGGVRGACWDDSLCPKVRRTVVALIPTNRWAHGHLRAKEICDCVS